MITATVSAVVIQGKGYWKSYRTIEPTMIV